jgi:nucleoside-diphosphate-sugar epimerase
MINLFGKGYIGTEFVRQFGADVLVNYKFDYMPVSNKVLYTISTTDNYNVHEAPHLDIDTNLTTFITFLENMRKVFGTDSEITFLSSWFVYGAQEDLPVKEDASCHPKGFYSITKYAAEMLLESYCNTFGMKYRILRLCNVIGGEDNGAGAKKNALHYMITEMCNDREVSLYDTGVYRDYMNVMDVVRAIKIAMDSDSTLGEIVNIGSGTSHKVQDLVYYAYMTMPTGKIKTKKTPTFHKNVQTDKMELDTAKLRSLGFLPEYSVYDTVDEIVKNAV